MSPQQNVLELHSTEFLVCDKKNYVRGVHVHLGQNGLGVGPSVEFCPLPSSLSRVLGIIKSLG
jgi:hypothetical protein